MNPKLQGLIDATRKAQNGGPAGILCDYLEDGLADIVPTPDPLRWAVRRLRWRINEILSRISPDQVPARWQREFLDRMLRASLEEIKQALDGSYVGNVHALDQANIGQAFGAAFFNRIVDEFEK